MLLPLQPGGINLCHNVPCFHVAIHALGKTGLSKKKKKKETKKKTMGRFEANSCVLLTEIAELISRHVFVVVDFEFNMGTFALESL